MKKKTDPAASTRNRYKVPIKMLKEKLAKDVMTAGTGLREFKRVGLETTRLKSVESFREGRRRRMFCTEQVVLHDEGGGEYG